MDHKGIKLFTYEKFTLDQFTPIAIYEKILEKYTNKNIFLFESASTSNEGTRSFIFIDYIERIWHQDSQSFYENQDKNVLTIQNNPLEFLKDYYKKIDQEKYKNINKDLSLGFVDGFIGYIGYESIALFEPKLKENIDKLKDNLHIPDLDLMRPRITIMYSHKTNKVTIYSPLKKLHKEILAIKSLLHKAYSYYPLKALTKFETGQFLFDKKTFFEMIDKSKAMIRAGDVFQILMSNRYTQKAQIDPLSFYRILKAKNPSPYMFLMKYKEFTIAGSSPEVMIKLEDNQALLRPIAGTRKRGKTAKKDQEMEDELKNDPKEISEHIMLIDLGRNDLGRVAQKGSVLAKDIMRVEKYSHVMHLVTDLNAKLDEQYDMFDLFTATFTAGTMTGAPKIRAMELIAEFEGYKRNFYSGSVGYFGFDGNMDTSITIRTAMIDKEKIILQAGAGIVADSVHELEYLEVRNKLGALIATIEDLKKINN